MAARFHSTAPYGLRTLAAMKTTLSLPLALSLVLLGAGLLHESRGDIAGFGDNGAGWTGNHAGGTAPVFAGDRLIITQNGEQNTAKSAWFETPQNVTTGFTALFTLRRVNAGGPGAREGTALVVQSTAAGTAALGTSGAGLGYATIGGAVGDTSLAFGFRAVVPAAGPAVSQFELGTNGSFGTAVNTSPVDLTLVDVPVQVGVSYNPNSGQVRVILLQNGHEFITTVPGVAISGSNLVGFTGATGSESETIEVSSFAFGATNVPIANDDVAGFAGPFVDIKPLANDTDPDLVNGDSLFVADTGLARFGTVEIIDATTVRYTPGANFPGQDTFTYTVSDLNAHASTAHIIVTRDAGAGTFIGISAPVTVGDPTLNASAALKVSPTGKFSGSVLWEDTRLAFKGAFDAEGKFTKVLASRSAPKITLTLDRFAEAGSIRVSLQEGLNSTQFQARPQIAVGKNGQLNVEIRRAGGVLEVGAGWASGKVTSAGAAKFAGVLPDGTKFSFSSGFNVFQDLPFLTYLYKKPNRGAAIGTIRLFAGNTMLITRPASQSGLYTAGFSAMFNTDSRLYFKPAAGMMVLPFPDAGPVNGSVKLTGGGLNTLIAQDIFLATNNKVSTVGTNDTGLKVKLDVKKGLVSGTFKYPGSGKKTKYSGVIFGDEARGVFTGPATAGEVLLSTP